MRCAHLRSVGPLGNLSLASHDASANVTGRADQLSSSSSLRNAHWQSRGRASGLCRPPGWRTSGRGASGARGANAPFSPSAGCPRASRRERASPATEWPRPRRAGRRATVTPRAGRPCRPQGKYCPVTLRPDRPLCPGPGPPRGQQHHHDGALIGVHSAPARRAAPTAWHHRDRATTVSSAPRGQYHAHAERPPSGTDRPMCRTAHAHPRRSHSLTAKHSPESRALDLEWTP